MKFHDAKKGTRVRLTKRVLYDYAEDGSELWVEAGTAGVVKGQWIDDDCSISVALDDGRLISIIEHELGDVEAESQPQAAVGS